MADTLSYSNASNLLKLAILARGSVGLTYDDIATEFGCNRRTAQRMARALAETFPQAEKHTEVETDDLVRWRLPDKTLTSLVVPTAEELAALSLAIEFHEGSQSDSEARLLRGLRSKLDALLSTSTSVRLETDEDALLQAIGRAFRPGPRSAGNELVNQAISDSLKGPFHLRVLYRSRSDEDARIRTIEPYGLLLGVRRYLLGKDISKNKSTIRHYRVEDIEEAEVLGTSFDLDAEFDLKKHASKAFGSYHDDEQFGEVRWLFSKKAATHAKRYLFHPEQEVLNHENGTLEVRFKASGHLEMCWHLYQWGDQVEVLAPSELAEMVSGYKRSDFEGLP